MSGADRPPPTPALQLEPIGVIHSPLTTKAEAARQPAAAADVTGVIELFPGRHFEHALEDLTGWERIWVVFWFHHNPSWRPKVLPPRSASGRKGVFATRSPHRPNPIGLSAVRLDRIEGLRLFVRDIDMLDGTPVLDLKPYVPYTDAYPAARSGWLADNADGETPADPLPGWTVSFEPGALAQAGWIEGRTGLPLRERIIATLQLGPAPHPYRRIRPDGDGFRLAVRDWRARFAVEGRTVRVECITSGYRPAELARGEDPEHAVHREFQARWGGAAGRRP